MREIPPEAFDLVKRFEGLRLVPYIDAAGWWTVGYGHKMPVKGGPIVEAGAMALLGMDLNIAGQGVCRQVPRAKVDLSDEQYAALLSFTFNLGAGALQASTLRRKINAGRCVEAAGEFGKWVFAGGRKLPGLVLRRAAERALFLKGLNHAARVFPPPGPPPLRVP